MSQELQHQLDEACTELVAKYHLSIAELDEQQIAEALKQAILAGDFQCNVLANTPSFTHTQGIVYLPGLGNDILRAENQKLRNLLAKHGIDEEEEIYSKQ